MCFGLVLALLGLCLSCGSRIVIEDASNVAAPLAENLPQNAGMIKAAKEGRLGVELPDPKGAGKITVPVQWLNGTDDGATTVVFLMPAADGAGKYDLREQPEGFATAMLSAVDPETGQINIMENDRPVLRYIYQTVYEDDVFAFNGMAPNEYAGRETDSLMANPSIYAVPRSNYIHPIFGPEGEILTRDWSRDHPHHRGIYWAWPEVDFGSKRGDLHALQKVFARPTGRIRLESGPVFAEVEAENLWLMEEGMVPIAREVALIRAYHNSENGRIIDLAFKFTGLKDSVTIARRGTEAYGHPSSAWRPSSPGMLRCSSAARKKSSKPAMPSRNRPATVALSSCSPVPAAAASPRSPAPASCPPSSSWNW